MIYNAYKDTDKNLFGLAVVSGGHIFAEQGRTISRPCGRDDFLLFYVAKGSELTNSVKIKYFLSRLFPPISYYRESYPKLARWIIPIPFLWVKRLFRGFGKSKTIAEEVNKVKDM
jgi:hypothetical protein